MTALIRIPPPDVDSRLIPYESLEVLRMRDHSISPELMVFVTSKAELVSPYPWIVAAKKISPVGLNLAAVMGSSNSIP